MRADFLCFNNIVDSLLIVAQIVCGGSVLVFVLCYSVL